MINVSNSKVEPAIKITDKNNNILYICHGDRVKFKAINRAKENYEGMVTCRLQELTFFADCEYLSLEDVEEIEII